MTHNEHITNGGTISCYASIVGTVFSIIQGGGTMLELMQYCSYGIAITVGLITVFDKMRPRAFWAWGVFKNYVKNKKN